MDRLDAIRNFAISKANEEKEAAYKAEVHRLQLVEKVEALAPRIQKMAKVARQMNTYNIPIGKPTAGTCLGSGTTNCTDHINHAFGFYVVRPYHSLGRPDYTLTGYFGKAMGGACGDIDFKIDIASGKIVSGDHLVSTMESFLERFDNVEKCFYAYVDEVVGFVA